MSQSPTNEVPALEAQDIQSIKPSALTTKQRNNLLWEPYKDDVRHIYVERRRPLREVMREIETKFQFKKSERNWKHKLKQWGFDKNMTSDIKFMVTKAEKRARDEGKETEFTRNGAVVPAETLHQFKKPRAEAVHGEDIGLVDMATPLNITYTTPKADEVGQEIVPPSPRGLANATDHNSFQDARVTTTNDRPHKLDTIQVFHSAASGLKIFFEFFVFLGSRQPLSISSYLTFNRDVSLLFEHYGLSIGEKLVVELMKVELIAALKYCKPPFESFDDNPGLRTERMHLRLLNGFLQHSTTSTHPIISRQKEICNAFMESAMQCSVDDCRGSVRLAFARTLDNSGLSTESLHQLIEAFYECLLLDKTEPLSPNCTLITELISRLRNHHEMGDILGPNPMVFPDIDTYQWGNKTPKRVALKLIYPAAALAAFSFRNDWRATGQKLVEEIRAEMLEESLESESSEDRIVLYLELFTHYRENGEGESTTAVSIISAAYAITWSMWKAERAGIDGETHDYRWQRAWMETDLPLYLDPKYQDLVDQLRDSYSFLADRAIESLIAEDMLPDSDALDPNGGIALPFRNPLMTFEEWSTYRPSGGVTLAKTKASVNTSSNQRSSKYGVTYTESLSAFSGMSLDYKALFPHSDN